jgi:hypothetical protein
MATPKQRELAPISSRVGFQVGSTGRSVGNVRRKLDPKRLP